MGSVMTPLHELHAGREMALVAKGDRVPAAGLTDDAPRRRRAIDDMTGAARGGDLFLDAADHRHPSAAKLRLRRPGKRNQKGDQGPLGIDASAAVEAPLFDARRGTSGDGVDVPEEEAPFGSLAALGDKVSDLVDPSAVAQGRKPLREKAREGSFLARGTRRLDRFLEKSDRLSIAHQGLGLCRVAR